MRHDVLAGRSVQPQRGAGRVLWLAGIAIVGVGLLALAQLGPSLFGYYRFDRAMRELARQNVETGPFPRLSDTCILCHGQRGNSVNTYYPQLAAQPSRYIELQLRAFATGKRVNPNMGPLAITLTEKEIDQLGDFFSHQSPVPPNTGALDSQLQARGRALVQRLSCASCHGAGLEGHDQYPRIAGQGEGYLTERLKAFQDDRESRADAAMRSIAAALGPQDIQDVAHYLAHATPEAHAATH